MGFMGFLEIFDQGAQDYSELILPLDDSHLQILSMGQRIKSHMIKT